MRGYNGSEHEQTRRRLKGGDMLATILRWTAIIMMVDSGIGILGLKFWNRRLPGLNIQKIALIEAALAIGILLLSFRL